MDSERVDLEAVCTVVLVCNASREYLELGTRCARRALRESTREFAFREKIWIVGTDKRGGFTPLKVSKAN